MMKAHVLCFVRYGSAALVIKTSNINYVLPAAVKMNSLQDILLY